MLGRAKQETKAYTEKGFSGKDLPQCAICKRLKAGSCNKTGQTMLLSATFLHVLINSVNQSRCHGDKKGAGAGTEKTAHKNMRDQMIKTRGGKTQNGDLRQ